MKKIVISGYYGFNNAGDEAILESIVTTLDSLAAEQGETLQFTVLSAEPATTAARLAVNAVSRTNFLAIVRAVLGSHALISGGGGLLQDSTGRGLSIPYYLGLVLLASLLGKKTIFYAQGIGPIRKKYNRLLTRLIVNRVSLISVRDQGSLDELLKLGVTRPQLTLTVDPAFLLEPADPNGRAAAVIEALPVGKPVVGIAVRSWHEEAKTLTAIAAAADCITRELAAVTVLVPMHYPEDLAAAEKLAGLMKSQTVILQEPLAPRELLAVFNCFSLVLAMRLHALIFAALAAVPLLGIAYDRKVGAFLERLGLSSAEEPGALEAVQLTAQALERWQGRDQLRRLLRERNFAFRQDGLQWAGRVLAFILK
ncbi:MAG: polysaccharide pyruvyl transferase CsaB [Dethiobacter sp.]|jgi:polysaccharide pyruvyl transferase CsaB|nr:polysaccharide pyruvyl transferase CsaB [Dethiobacter sp.]MBS3899635.1 polysaccharide pyruvyl transferase CsaB [Dethiobacter sp.]MBS3948512.1 polysaccharide pyruvyl transferase CsaB [Dethiobacter sp.]